MESTCVALVLRYFPLLYSEAGYNDLYEYFLRGKESLRIDQKVQKVTGLNREQVSIKYYNTLLYRAVICCLGFSHGTFGKE